MSLWLPFFPGDALLALSFIVSPEKSLNESLFPVTQAKKTHQSLPKQSVNHAFIPAKKVKLSKLLVEKTRVRQTDTKDRDCG